MPSRLREGNPTKNNYGGSMSIEPKNKKQLKKALTKELRIKLKRLYPGLTPREIDSRIANQRECKDFLNERLRSHFTSEERRKAQGRSQAAY
ncbi:hypothetical protein VIBNIFTn2_1110015 [Vibrio nigripulchritudo FTn2]|nr:hypothetical protein VIBNIFTn2_1110015 [Vibrio nigripulchritudo FTn2]